MWCTTRVNSRSIALFLYINDLYLASNILEPIMFADDTNLFYSHSNIKTLFNTVNLELNKLNEWFKTNQTKPSIHFFTN